jgi:hypothetical protein
MALVMALLALLLLTVLGLTLATSTSSEVQVATNYRWSLQALYNAEAGVEVAKAVLRPVQRWDSNILAPRGAGNAWNPSVNTAVTKPPLKLGTTKRDFEMGGPTGCDKEGGQLGYGTILVDPAGGASAALEDVSTYQGMFINGMFTVWVRRPFVVDPATGWLHDYDPNTSSPDVATLKTFGVSGLGDVLIVTSEGVAPSNLTGTFAAGHRAVQVVEATLYQAPTTVPCEVGRGGQDAAGQGGAGVDPCVHPGGANAAGGPGTFDLSKMGVTPNTTGTATRQAH